MEGQGLALVWVQAAAAAATGVGEPQPCSGVPTPWLSAPYICDHLAALLRTSHNTELAVQRPLVGRPGVVAPCYCCSLELRHLIAIRSPT
jgi:hypothetical protein